MDFKPIFEKLYPEGSTQGECGIFAHKLISFRPVGDSFAQKKVAVKTYGILAASLKGDIRPGDVVITSEGTWLGWGHGHVAVANFCNPTAVFLTESNFNLDGKVHHLRYLRKDSPVIVGVIRGSFLFTPPPEEPEYPVQLRVRILMNKQPFWNSLLQHMANMQGWAWEASGNKLQLILDYKETNLDGWPMEFTSDSMGFGRNEIIKRGWLEANLPALALGCDVILFCMPRKDWKGTVFDHPDQIELGYAYQWNSRALGQRKLPMIAMLVSDEHDDYPPYYPKLGAFAKLAWHEISHLLYMLCLDENKKFTNPQTGGQYTSPPGSDLTHNRFFGINYSPMEPELIFGDLDLKKLKALIKK